MATITRDAVNKANEKLSNNFRLDVQFYCLWNDKQAHKYIDFPNNEKLECVIGYHDKSTYKCFEKIANYDIEISFHLWKPSVTGGYTSLGTGYHQTISTGHSKKQFNKIQVESANWPDELCKATFNELLAQATPMKLEGFLF